MNLGWRLEPSKASRGREWRRGGRAGDDADFEFPLSLVLDPRLSRDGGGNDLGGSGRGEPAEADHLVMVDQGRGFIGGEGGKCAFHG